jgi:F-type H+-transporting ATPase subunit epsilon
MADKLHLRVVTPERPLFDGEVDSVVVPAHDGEVGILPRHTRFLASLGAGELRAVRGDKTERWFVDGGFVQVHHDRVIVLCDRASALADADLAAVEAAAEAARAAKSPDAARLRHSARALRRITSRSKSSVGH